MTEPAGISKPRRGTWCPGCNGFVPVVGEQYCPMCGAELRDYEGVVTSSFVWSLADLPPRRRRLYDE